MRKGRIGLVAAALASLAVVTAVLSQMQPAERFPHERHARLFPLCEGCHEGVETGDVSEFYPDPALCARCHDGVREPVVEWTGPVRPITNLAFSHPGHDEVSDQPLECTTCHTPAGAPRMRVELAVAQQCFDCHAHEARDHFVDANCTTCHVPLAETPFRLARVLALPIPVTHEHPRFLAEVHGELALQDPSRCSTCHTRELCTSCHVNVPAVPVIARLPRAGSALELPRFAASYPVPESHLDPRWEQLHGRAASVAECSTCHTRESCATCHQERLPRIAAELPARATVTAPGVTTGMRAPESHRSPSFAMRHGAVAATRKESCSSCHVQSTFCAACHSPVASGTVPAGTSGEVRLASAALVLPARTDRGPVAEVRQDTVPRRLPTAASVHVPQEQSGARPIRRGPLQAAEFHPPGFVTRHSAAAYGRRLDCAQCHNPRVFCRDCHTESGFQAAGRLGAGFHDAEPMFLLRHGQAARQTLESCTTCHAQRDCLQCHSSLGAFRVNPHRTGFDARAAQRRNPAICLACHALDPLGRSAP
jgi:hypothetical protein